MGAAGANGAGGAGGGGSDFVSGTVPGSPVTVVDGPNAGDGQIVFVFTQDAPTVTAVSPDSGPPAGGNTVTVTGTGTNLTGATITFGTNSATGVTCTITTRRRAVTSRCSNSPTTDGIPDLHRSDDSIRHRFHEAARPTPEQRKRNPQAQKDNSFIDISS